MPTTAVSTSGWPVIGHDRPVARLRQMVSQNQYPPAILITGPRHVGRRTLALRFVQAALCPQQVNAVSCETCSICHRIGVTDPPVHPDVRFWSITEQELESGAKRRDSGAEQSTSSRAVLSIESVRKIAGWTAFRPIEAARTFIIIDDVETLADPAQQAMLKVLEDAPDYVTIILLATNASALLDTVLSRCVEIPLQLAPTDLIAASLDSADAQMIAAEAAGRPGWAIRATRDADWHAVQVESFTKLEGWLRKTRADQLIEAYTRGDGYTRNRASTIEGLERIQLIWRDCLLVSTGMGQYAFDRDRTERLSAGSGADLAGWHAALTATRQCVQDLVGNIRPRLAMQHMVNQWPNLS